jgi:Tfp pilus assembly pilus retraction ATPase PilT
MALATNLVGIACQRLIPKATGPGVAPAIEVMINTPIVRKLIEEGKIDKLPQVIGASTNEGMMTFDQCLLKLLNEGQITEEMALQKATNREMLKMNMKGIFLSGGAILG